jgi:hypothetical protein
MASSRNNALEFSSAGSVIINSSSGVVTGKFGAVQCLKDSTFGTLVATNIPQTGPLLTSFAAGTILYGDFTEILVSGTGSLVAAHRV